MKFLHWAIFWFFLGSSAGWSLENKNTSINFSEKVTSKVKPTAMEVVPQTEISVEITSALPEETKLDILTESENGVQKKKEESVSVIKRTELESLLEAVSKKHHAYLSVNRYERVAKASSGKNQGQLQIELTHDIKPTIRVMDRSLVLGGNGFGATGLEASDYKLHFTFDSHIKVSPIYEVEKENVSHFDPDFEKAKSEKFLIFHRSSSNFGRQTNLFGEFKHEQPFGKKMVYTKVEAAPSSWIFLDAHIKDFQNKETSIHLLPAIKPLDLIYDNPAILQYDYQILNSGGS